MVQQVFEISVRDGKLLQKPVLLEEFDSEMKQGHIAKYLVVLENVEVPFVEVVHHFDGVVPDSRSHFDSLLELFFLFFELLNVDLLILTVNFLQKVV